MKAKRKPLSTPASPSRTREPQCTCMTTEQYARLRAQDPRYKGKSDVACVFLSQHFNYFHEIVYEIMSLNTTLTNTNHNMMDAQTFCQIS